MNIWLDREILEWEPFAQGGSYLDKSAWRKVYSIWKHVERLTPKADDEHVRVDIVNNLWRVVDQRVQMLRRYYDFRKLPMADKPKETLDILEWLGIIRRPLLQKLIDLRNLVEHEDSTPPDVPTCVTLLEFTWFFLKATDRLAQFQVDSILCENGLHDGADWVEFTVISEGEWGTAVRGQVPAEFVSIEKKDDWFLVVTDKVKDKESSIFFNGDLRGTAPALLDLYTLYFELSQ